MSVTQLQHLDLWARDERGDLVEACKQIEDPDLMFPPDDRESRDLDVLEAKRVCQGCYFQSQCLSDAIDRRESHGIWGGMTPRERAAMIRRRDRRRNAGARVGQDTLWDVAL